MATTRRLLNERRDDDGGMGENMITFKNQHKDCGYAVQIELPDDDATADDVLEAFFAFMVACGYTAHTVNKSISDWCSVATDDDAA